MAARTVFTCVCGVQKKTSNHWILAKATPDGLTLMPWDWSVATHDKAIVLCGEGCAVALLSRHLGQWKQKAMEQAAHEAALTAA